MKDCEIGRTCGKTCISRKGTCGFKTSANVSKNLDKALEVVVIKGLVKQLKQAESEGHRKKWFEDPKGQVYVRFKPNRIELASFEVTEQYQGRGIGFAIAKTLHDYAKASGRKFFMENCNEASSKIAKKLGLEDQGYGDYISK